MNVHSREERIALSLAEDVIIGCKHSGVTRLKKLVDYQRMGSDMEQMVRELHDILKSYYAVALDRFVDNVCMQAASFFLMTGEETPMSFFSSSFVSSLTDEQLEEIAGEDTGLRRKRTAEEGDPGAGDGKENSDLGFNLYPRERHSKEL
ncbi:hypothetical protein BDV29DRAFT_11082 [Aspergillus leporis]|jgi:hypothetical protein|uniref:GED domain-containing protein n=1 Tax=Aspergillus leporis TaxID=41062 RepID=A0A5N5WTJ0_9EURO|nr:hypothetical protein BDV29DRAFT_11082 [Aspergillus leporis]